LLEEHLECVHTYSSVHLVRLVRTTKKKHFSPGPLSIHDGILALNLKAKGYVYNLIGQLLLRRLHFRTYRTSFEFINALVLCA